MALLQNIGRRVMLAAKSRQSIRCVTSTPPKLQAVKVQHEFTGLEGCFVWDDKHGFGFTKEGEVVLVTPNASAVPSEISDIGCLYPEADRSIESTLQSKSRLSFEKPVKSKDDDQMPS